MIIMRELRWKLRVRKPFDCNPGFDRVDLGSGAWLDKIETELRTPPISENEALSAAKRGEPDEGLFW